MRAQRRKFPQKTWSVGARRRRPRSCLYTHGERHGNLERPAAAEPLQAKHFQPIEWKNFSPKPKNSIMLGCGFPSLIFEVATP